MTVLERLAGFLVEARERAPSTELFHHGKRAVIDWFGAVVPGGREPPASVLRAELADELGRGEAVLYPSGERAPVRTAALINGTASHALEVDDIYRDGLLHPGCTVIPAALAVAQRRDASGRDLVAAVILGYEVAARIAAAVSPAHYRFWHTTGTVGGFGAAAAAGTLLGLDAEPMTWALAHAGTLGAGLQEAFRSDSMSKPVHAGHAAGVGVLAAALAAGGAPGAKELLEGEVGFGRAMADDPDWAAALDGLGDAYAVARVTVKNHPCCGHTFAAIDACLELRERHGLEADDVAGISVATYATAVEVTGNPRPETAAEARFSLPWVVAWAVVHGSVGFDAFSAEGLADRWVRDLMERVELEVDPEHDRAFPGRRGARVELRTPGGERLERRRRTRKGDPDDPLSDGELEAKFRGLVAPVVGGDEGAALLEKLWSLESVESLREPGFAVSDVAPGGRR